MDKITLWGRIGVGYKIGLIVVLFVAAIAGIISYTIIEQRGKETESLIMDMAARQRELVQLYTRDVYMTSQGMKGDQQYWSNLYFETSDAMIDGGKVTVTIKREEKAPIPAAPTQEIREKLSETRAGFEEVTALGNQILESQRGGPAAGNKVKEMLDRGMKLRGDINSIVKIYERFFRAKVEEMIRQQIMIGVAVGFIGILLSWFITSGILTPLSAVVSNAQGIARGDLRQEKLSVSSSDEIGQLAVAFNSMQDTLREITKQTHEGTLNLNSACQEILASTQQQAASAKEQASAIHETTTTVEEVRQAGSQISDRAKQVAQAAEANSTASRTGLKAVQDTAQTMDKVREQFEAVAENVVALSEKTQAVGEIISSVNDIAEQSHLLALNAALEASAAGEAGRNFSIVAGEVKSLADQAKQATVQVRTILTEIQKGITGSVMLTEEAVKRVEAGKSQAVVAEKTIKELADTTVESVQAFQQTIATTNQQQIGYDQVTQALQDIRKASEQTAAGTSQLEKATSNLTALSSQLRKSVERFQL